MGVRLPAEYQKVEYLEKPLLNSVAVTVYIDTGIITSNNIDYDFAGQALGNNETVTFFGGREAFQNKSNEVVYTLHHQSVPTGAQFRYGYKAGATAVFAESPAINIHEVKRYKKEGTVFTCNNSSSTTAQQTFSYNKTITLFDVNQRTGMVGSAGGTRIFYFKLYESGVLVRDYIPCYRKADSEPGMYDLVSGTFFTNAGTGEFVVGPDVIDSISPWLVTWRRGLIASSGNVRPIKLEHGGLNNGFPSNGPTDLAFRARSIRCAAVMRGKTYTFNVQQTAGISVYFATWTYDDADGLSPVTNSGWSAAGEPFTPDRDYVKILISINGPGATNKRINLDELVTPEIRRVFN